MELILALCVGLLSFVFRSCQLISFVSNVVFGIPMITIIEIWLKMSVVFFNRL